MPTNKKEKDENDSGFEVSRRPRRSSTRRNYAENDDDEQEPVLSKVKKENSKAPENLQSSAISQDLSAYERDRLATIRKNEEMMQSLGLAAAAKRLPPPKRNVPKVPTKPEDDRDWSGSGLSSASVSESPSDVGSDHDADEAPSSSAPRKPKKRRIHEHGAPRPARMDLASSDAGGGPVPRRSPAAKSGRARRQAGDGGAGGAGDAGDFGEPSQAVLDQARALFGIIDTRGTGCSSRAPARAHARSCALARALHRPPDA